MITSNADEIAKELQKYAEDVERKLKAMVAGFAGDMVESASTRTKAIDANLLSTEKWQGIYEARQEKYRIPIEPGYHAGAWKYVDGQLTFDNPSIRSTSEASSDAVADARVQYKLGQTFSIGLIGPAAAYAGPDFSSIEPVILTAYSSNIKRYFDQG